MCSSLFVRDKPPVIPSKRDMNDFMTLLDQFVDRLAAMIVNILTPPVSVQEVTSAVRSADYVCF